MQDTYFTQQERKRLPALVAELLRATRDVAHADDVARVRKLIEDRLSTGSIARMRGGLNVIEHSLETAIALCRELSVDRNMVLAVMLSNIYFDVSEGVVAAEWGDDVAALISGLRKVSTLYAKSDVVMSDNFRDLLLTFARDIRVIIIMIVERYVLMKAINHHPDGNMVREVAFESAYLYAPLAHRLGLYAIKGQLEDMSLKYTNREVFTDIAHKLNATKRDRDAYIASFIEPVKRNLEAAGLKFDIKGRTKSIYSIWNKMKKQHNDVDQIYDLFAIRIIIDTPLEREKADCWLAYSVITEMYQPNPSRLKDWLSIPKSNGYESLHITVRGPQNRWVEVQIRTRRMDTVAEKGLAAHWRYKGLKSGGSLDAWMNNVRDILETAESGPMELMKSVSMNLYHDEVFVFTPRGDIHKLPLGATVLDFAFNIHSGLGCTCVGAKVNGKVRKLNYKIQSGDTVEILTSQNQIPKQDWLNFVVTAKARNKIRSTLNEMAKREAEPAKELFMRRLKNRKIEFDEATLMRMIKKLGYKAVNDFYVALGTGQRDVNDTVTEYELMLDGQGPAAVVAQSARSADEFTLQEPQDESDGRGVSAAEVLVIGSGDIRGLNYRMARCCNPIFGDDVFGFISSDGVVKIHRKSCPNAANIMMRYPYRLIPTRWSGEGCEMAASISITGRDDIGIVTNISSIINKEKDASLRSISIDSHDGIFQGVMSVGIKNATALNQLIKKIKTVKGIKDVTRQN